MNFLSGIVCTVCAIYILAVWTGSIGFGSYNFESQNHSILTKLFVTVVIILIASISYLYKE